MKKFYIFLASLLAIVGIGVVNAFVVNVKSTPVTQDTAADGTEFLITMNITNLNGEVGNHNLSTETPRIIFDNDEEYTSIEEKAANTVTEAYVWKLEAGHSDADGQWYYIKNIETERYLGYNVDESQDPSNVEALPDEDSFVNGVQSWFNEDGGLQCNIWLTLVDTQAEAREFLLKKPSEGILYFGTNERPENVQDLIQTVDDTHTMMLTKIEVNGKGYWAAMNSAFNGHLARYSDWAAYWNLLETEVMDDPITEFENYKNTVDIWHIQIGDGPGFVADKAAAEAWNERMEFLQNALDDDHSDDEWRAYLAELKQLVSQYRDFEVNPMVPGFYRFVCAYPGYVENQGVEKAMYAVVGQAKWATLDPGTEIMEDITEEVTDPETGDVTTTVVGQQGTGKFSGFNQIWQVTEGEEGRFKVKNLETNQYLYVAANAANAANVTMRAEETLTEFTPLVVNGDFNIFVNGNTKPLHTAGHNSGAGVSGNVVLWPAGTGSCSAWQVRPVTEDEIKSIWGENAIANAEVAAAYREKLAEAKALLAKAESLGEVQCEVSTTKIITDVNQLSTNAQESTEGPIENLLDENNATYWHTDWHGSVSDPHYLQVDMQKEYKGLSMHYVNRNGSSYQGWPKEFRIDYCDTADGEYTEGVTIEDVQYGTDAKVQDFYFELPVAARYIRIFATRRFSNDGDSTNPFWHAAEIQLYEAVRTGDDIDFVVKAGVAGTNLRNAIAAAEDADPSQEGIDALQAAIDAFTAVFTDPTTLRAEIAEAKEQLATIAAGNDPGQKPESVWNALNSAMEAAEAWLKANLATCTKAELTAQEEAMQAALDAWYASAVNGLDLTKWYYIEFVGTDRTASGYAQIEDGTKLIGARMSALMGSEVNLAEFGAAATSHAYGVPASVYNGEVTLDDYEYNEQMSQWRLLAINENTYAIQNRATGNFLPAMQADCSVNADAPFNLSPVPGRYGVEATEDGAFSMTVVFGKNAAGEDTLTYVHQDQNGKIATWRAMGEGGRWMFRPAEAIAADYEQEIIFGIDSMVVRGYTLPYAISSQGEGDAYVFNDIVGIDTENGAVGVAEAFDDIKAGTPFLVFSDESETGTSQFKVQMLGTDLSWNVNRTGALNGTLEMQDSISAGSAVPTINLDDTNYMGSMWGGFTSLNAKVRAACGSAWIDLHNTEASLLEWNVDDDQTADNVLCLDTTNGELFDAIEVVKGDNGKVTVVYNLNGQRVSAQAKGLVIMNGKKVILK